MKCSACSECVIDPVEAAHVSAEMLAFNRQVNATMVDPAFIASVRRKLALDQREAAEIFGGSIKASSRYENGKTRPSLALVKLLKLTQAFVGYTHTTGTRNVIRVKRFQPGGSPGATWPRRCWCWTWWWSPPRWGSRANLFTD